MRRFVISCEAGGDADALPVPGAELFPCVRVDRTSTPPLSWRARAVLDGQLETTDISNLPSFGAVGCYLSHVALWRQLVASGDEAYAIFEDDARVRRPADLERVLRDAGDHPEYDVLFLGWRFPLDTLFGRRRGPPDASGRFQPMLAPRFYETHAYVIRRRAAEALLRDALPIEMQIDAYMGLQRQRLGLRFLLPVGGPIVTQRRCIWDSSIQTDLMRQCALCRLPAEARSGWATLGLLVLLLILVALAVHGQSRRRSTP